MSWPRLDARMVLSIILVVLGITCAEAGVRGGHLTSTAGSRARSGAAGNPALPVPGWATRGVEALRGQPDRFIHDRARAAIVDGVVFGRTDGIDPNQRQEFRDSGLWHLLAASGQNVALVVLMCVIGTWLAGAGRLLGMVVALAAIPGYAMVVGGGASIMRAALMGELACLAWLLGRRGHAWDAVATSAVAIVWIWPGSHRTLGFQLSYACVIALLVWCDRVTFAMRRFGIPRSAATILAATALCGLATMPILLTTMGQAPLAASVVNLVAIPVAGGMLVTGLCASLLAFVTADAARPLFALVEAGAWLLTQCSDLGRSVPFAMVTTDDVARWIATARLTAVAVASIAAVAVLARMRPDSWRAVRTLAVITVVATAFAGASVVVDRNNHGPRGMPPIGVLRVVALDVGQGDAILIQTPHAAMLVDAGPPGAQLLPVLRRAGVRHLDAVIVTHHQLDHLGGLAQLAPRLPIGWIGRPRTSPVEWGDVQRIGIPLHSLCVGDELRLPDRVIIEIVAPSCTGMLDHVTTDVINDNGIVAVIRIGSVRVALCADVESGSSAVRRLGPVDVLKLAHHGSSDEALPGLLERVHPRIALVSVGTRNTYGHPSRQALDALDRAGVTVLRTDRDGSIGIETDGVRVWQSGGDREHFRVFSHAGT